MDAEWNCTHGFWCFNCTPANSASTPRTPTPGNGWKLGLAFAVVGVLTVLLSTQHYFAVREDIDQETYQPPDRWIFLASLAVTLLGAGVIYYVFTIPLENLETYVLE